MARYTTRAAVPSQIQVSVEVDPVVPLVRGHYDTLARALTNVLLNACDACEHGGSIEVRVTTARMSDSGAADTVRILVHDSGTGIPPIAWRTCGSPT